MSPTDMDETSLIAQHIADHDHHRFQNVIYRGVHWDLSHLNPFAFFVEIEKNRRIVVLVLFSCHCFTHKPDHDDRERIPQDELYNTPKETRVLNEERYNFSKGLLLQIVSQFEKRHITVAQAGRNFITVEQLDQEGKTIYYGVFFEVEKGKHRKSQIILRVQTAYPLKSLTKRLQGAKKVGFSVLIKAVHEGRKIRP
jgi:hypothetical protein